MGIKVKERNPGEWWIFINYHGKRKAKKIGRDKHTAVEAAKKIEAKLALDGFPGIEEKEVLTFGEYAAKYIATTIPATCKPSALKGCKALLKNHVLPVFKDVRVNEINRLMVKEFLMKKSKEGFASSTVTHMKNTISGPLNLALDDGALAVNPAQRLGKVIREKSLRLEADPLSREELSLLLDIFREHYPGHYPLVLTLARTGMRIGEALGLQWGDIDFNGRFITIKRGISKGRIDTPKNGKSRRVDMSMQLTDALLGLRQDRRIETMKKGWGDVPEWVFITTDGTSMDESSWRRRVFNKALEKAKLRQIRVHDLRHGYASMMIQAGESLAYIRDQLGHHSIKVTVDIYGHLAPEGNKGAVDRLDDATIRNPGATRKDKELTNVG